MLCATENTTKTHTLNFSTLGGFFLVLLGIYLTSFYKYQLFHTLIELFCIIVAGCIFMLAWNGRRIIQNNYLLYIGIAYLFVAGIDLFHTLSYPGMGIFQGYDTNLPTQLWIAGRYMESISLFCAPFFAGRKLNPYHVLIAYILITCLALASVFYWHNFPVCYVEGAGLTPFKKISEYIISVILLASLTALSIQRKHFDRDVLIWLIGNNVLTIFSELAFTFYFHVYDVSNLIGHLLKAASFYLLYRAVVVTSFNKPYGLLFRELQKRESELVLSRKQLENSHQSLEIKSRKQAMDLIQAEDTLKLERERFFYVLENLPAFLCLQKKDFTIAYANKYFKERFGDPEKKPCFQMLHGRDGPCEGCRSHLLLDSLEPHELKLYEASDNRIYHVYNYPFVDVDGTTIILKMGVDITERVEAEKKLEDYSRQLELQNLELHSFAYVASHDLQEPLRKIQAFGNRLRSKYIDILDDKGKDYLLRMESAAHRMRLLIQALLEYSRMDAQSRTNTRVDLNVLMGEVAGDLEDQLNRTNGRVEVGKLPSIEGEPTEIYRLFQNLISNAIKFNDKPEPFVRISGKIMKDPDLPTGGKPGGIYYEISVEDNGIGFEEEYADQIFIPFRRLHGSHIYEGTGIGLSICRKIVERHHGRIAAKSVPGIGSAFRVMLPGWKD